MSHLLQMRGLKLKLAYTVEGLLVSHLLQMRGLKQRKSKVKITVGVASFTDAWIETIVNSPLVAPYPSHLLQMRGLKHKSYCNQTVARSHLLQMRGLKQFN